MEARVFSIPRSFGFSRRVQRCLDRAGVSSDTLLNIRRFPRVLKMFHLATPLALQALDNDVELLSDLNAFFSRAAIISGPLYDRILKMGLVLGYCHDGSGARLVCYTLRRPFKEDAELLMQMRTDLIMKPGIEDAEMLFGAFGFQLKTLGQWQPDQVKRLTDVDMDKLMSVANQSTNIVVASVGSGSGMTRTNGYIHLEIQRGDPLEFRAAKVVRLCPAKLT